MKCKLFNIHEEVFAYADNKSYLMSKYSVMLKRQNDMELLLQRLPILNDYFQLHNKIGQGTFSTVYLATLRNSSSTQKFAVKHLTQTCEQSRIQNELRCLQEIGGKDNVVHAELCLANGDDCVTFVMPYLPHLRFSDYVIDMDAEETRLYMKNLFIALKRVHSFNIIHRDVKPDNFLYNRETKQFLLVDFGLAQLVRIPNQESNKDSSLANENLPIDYSKKRKRSLDSSDDERKTSVKTNKRIALKSKDNNVRILPKTCQLEARVQNDKGPVFSLTQEKEGPKLPTKRWSNQDIDKDSVKPKTLNVINIPSSSRRKLSNFQDTRVNKKSLLGQNGLKHQVESMESVESRCKFLSDNSSLTSTKLPNLSYSQAQNSKQRFKQQTVSSTSKSDAFLKQLPSTSSFPQSCPCNGKGAVCSICSSRKRMFAPRAGTSGFRPPEVLFRYPHQTTAVDMWASGVVLLCILSGCYPFFNSSTDLISLAEIMTVFGTENIIKVATKFGRRILCSENTKGVDLKKLCVRLRARSAKMSKAQKTNSNEPKCRDCFQNIRKDGCLCPSDEVLNETEGTGDSDITCRFPQSAFDLLHRLLDLDPTTRITAAEALEHPFITGL